MYHYLTIKFIIIILIFDLIKKLPKLKLLLVFKSLSGRYKGIKAKTITLASTRRADSRRQIPTIGHILL